MRRKLKFCASFRDFTTCHLNLDSAESTKRQGNQNISESFMVSFTVFTERQRDFRKLWKFHRNLQKYTKDYITFTELRERYGNFGGYIKCHRWFRKFRKLHGYFEHLRKCYSTFEDCRRVIHTLDDLEGVVGTLNR